MARQNLGCSAMALNDKLRTTRKILKWLLISVCVLVIGVVAFVVIYSSTAAFDGLHEFSGFGYDQAFDIARTSDGSTSYTVNTSIATFALDVEPPDAHCKCLFPNYAAALRYCRTSGLPTLASVHIVRGKLKQFDDGLLTTLDLAVADGRALPDGMGKRQALARLLEILLQKRQSGRTPAIDKAIVHVATALDLAGVNTKVPDDLTLQLHKAIDDFRERALESRPLGAWAWNSELRQLFQSDRFLMAGIGLDSGADAAVLLATAVGSDRQLSAAFRRIRELDSRLTNPASALGFDQLASLTPEEARRRFGEGARFALVSYSTSKEETFLNKLYAQGRLTERVGTMDSIIDAVRSGRIPMDPKPDSGWYDCQWFALETLLRPEIARESRKLHWSRKYKERLQGAFASALTESRESQIKRLPVVIGDLGVNEVKPRVEIGPQFIAEPLPTVYLRLARGYRFVQQRLRAALGDEAMKSLHRLREGQSPSAVDLATELTQTQLLCYGLYDRLCYEIGQLPQYEPGEIDSNALSSARQIVEQWTATLTDDIDLAADARSAVPVVMWPGGPARYWANCGVTLQRVQYRFIAKPSVKGRVEPVFVPTTSYLATDVFAEFLRTGIPPTREEFRQLCSRYPDEETLRAALGAPITKGGLSLSRVRAIFVKILIIAMPVGLVVVWWRFRSSRRWILASASVCLIAWATALLVSPRYRAKCIVRYIARVNPGFGIYCEARLLPAIPQPARVAGLTELLRDPDAQIRYLAASFLDDYSLENDAAWIQPGVREALMAAANDPDAVTAAHVIGELEHYRDEQTISFLLQKLRDDKQPDAVCACALSALGRIGDSNSVGTIASYGDDPRASVSRAAIWSLGRIATSDAVSHLARFTVSSRPLVRKNALEALQSMRSTEPLHVKLTQGDMDVILLGAMDKTDVPFATRLELACALTSSQSVATAYGALTRASTTANEMSQSHVWRTLFPFQFDKRQALPTIQAIAIGLTTSGKQPQMADAIQRGDVEEQTRLLVQSATTALQSDDETIRGSAVCVLSALGPRASAALPALEEARRQRRLPVFVIDGAIKQIEHGT
jgi:hypothetical protein